jgi:hypothetical protein
VVRKHRSDDTDNEHISHATILKIGQSTVTGFPASGIFSFFIPICLSRLSVRLLLSFSKWTQFPCAANVGKEEKINVRIKTKRLPTSSSCEKKLEV